MRGEHPRVLRPCHRWTGSSPHARGAPDPLPPVGEAAGIIPACAGSTQWAIELLLPIRGSSPHARGARQVGGRGNARRGIIPACAGSTTPAARNGRESRDHPRMRGEHCTVELSDWTVSGSSPHARGALQTHLVRVVVQGIIPACAGSTHTAAGRVADARDHPRMRGEHALAVAAAYPMLGSSPHARGALERCFCQLWRPGIIPACAGSTRHGQRGREPSGDHPRMRGEHTRCVCSRPRAAGSSPHARGALYHEDLERLARGIIPACAGSTRWRLRWNAGCKDHPRMRGEHLWTRRMSEPGEGSSPHARGAPYPYEPPYANPGIIPACAGSTMCGKALQSTCWDHPRMRGEHSTILLSL